MTALTTMFNFIVVYVQYFCTIIFGGRLYLSSFSGEQYEIAKNMFDALGVTKVIYVTTHPILLLFIGIIVIGAIIGLARRLIRG